MGLEFEAPTGCNTMVMRGSKNREVVHSTYIMDIMHRIYCAFRRGSIPVTVKVGVDHWCHHVEPSRAAYYEYYMPGPLIYVTAYNEKIYGRVIFDYQFTNWLAVEDFCFWLEMAKTK